MIKENMLPHTRLKHLALQHLQGKLIHASLYNVNYTVNTYLRSFYVG